MSCVPQADLQLYVMGALPAERASAVEDHVLACERCAASLAGEARLEVALHEAFAPTKRAPVRLSRRPRPRSRGPLVVAVGVLSLAAAWLFWLLPAASHEPTDVAPGTVEEAIRLDASAVRDVDGG